MGLHLSALFLALLSGVAVACSSSDGKAERSVEQTVGTAAKEPGRPTRFAERGVSLETPSGWSVSGFSETVFPRRLVAASYPVTRADVEGDCGGLAAVERLPSDGAYVVLIDYGGNFDPDLMNRSISSSAYLSRWRTVSSLSSGASDVRTHSVSSPAAEVFKLTSGSEQTQMRGRGRTRSRRSTRFASIARRKRTISRRLIKPSVRIG
jgi:hypothetical protein